MATPIIVCLVLHLSIHCTHNSSNVQSVTFPACFTLSSPSFSSCRKLGIAVSRKLGKCCELMMVCREMYNQISSYTTIFPFLCGWWCLLETLLLHNICNAVLYDGQDRQYYYSKLQSWVVISLEPRLPSKEHCTIFTRSPLSSWRVWVETTVVISYYYDALYTNIGCCFMLLLSLVLGLFFGLHLP